MLEHSEDSWAPSLPVIDARRTSMESETQTREDGAARSGCWYTQVLLYFQQASQWIYVTTVHRSAIKRSAMRNGAHGITGTPRKVRGSLAFQERAKANGTEWNGTGARARPSSCTGFRREINIPGYLRVHYVTVLGRFTRFHGVEPRSNRSNRLTLTSLRSSSRFWLARVPLCASE